MKIYYKLVEQVLDNNKIVLQSINQNSDPELILEYKLDNWTYPKIIGSQIFVFNSLYNLNQFRNSYSGYKNCKIYEVQIIKSKSKLKLFVDPSRVYCLSALKTILNLRKKHQSITKSGILYTNAIPAGTIFADAVKLIKEVQ